MILKNTGSKTSGFQMKGFCFLCCQRINLDISRRKKGHEISFVKTDTFDKSIREVCNQRNDEWALDVLGRISCVSDLHAADVCYHRQCNINLRTNLGIPSNFILKTASSANGMKRKNDERSNLNARSKAFMATMSQFQKEDDGDFSIKDLCALMADEAVEPYTEPLMKQRILEHFKENVSFTAVRRGEVKVCLRSSTAEIMRAFYQSKFDSDIQKTEDQKK